MRNKDKRNGLKIAAVVFQIIYILAAMFAAVSVTMIDALPGKYICAGCGAIVVLSVITGILSLGRKRKKGREDNRSCAEHPVCGRICDRRHIYASGRQLF